VERFRLVRPLGARVVPSWAALDASAGSQLRLVVVERVNRGAEYGDQEIADWVRDARRIATLEHPNVARVHDVVIAGEEVCVVSDYVDGVRWMELVAAEPRPPLEVALRVVVDVLTGLSAIHNLRDAKREPLKLVHGELTPECIVVGLDGTSRIVSTARLRSATARPGQSGSAYLAPEILLADESADARADVYGIGVILWELLSGRPLFPNTQPAAIVTHLLSGRVPLPTIPDGNAWAAPLADLTARALSADPSKRFASAAAMAAEIRRIAGPRLAPPTRIAAHVRGVFGDRIRSRREQLDKGEVPATQAAQPVEPVEGEIPISVTPSPVPPQPTATTKPPTPLAAPPSVPKLAPPAVPKLAPPAPPRISVPTPLVAMPIPPAARLPEDLKPGLGEVRVQPPAAETRAESPAPAVPPVVTPLDSPPPAPRPRSRGTTLALLAVSVVLGAAAVVWWLALRSPEPTAAATPAVSTSAPVAVAPPTPPSATPPADDKNARLAAPPPPPQPSPSPANEGPAPRGPDQTPAQAAPYPAAPQAPPIVRAPPRPKYQPEGI
jgi:serine/threonine-protein kinase